MYEKNIMIIIKWILHFFSSDRTLSARSLSGTKNLILRSFFFNELACIYV
jgi:hypothetical protein